MILERKNYFLRILCWLLIVSISFIGATVTFASEPKYGGVLRVATTSNPVGLDPMAVTHVATREIVVNIFEPLVAFNESYEVVPMLAKDWDISEDGTIYTFYLREGVPFHNGKTMKAEDVKASVERYIKISPYKENFADLEEIKIVNDYTVEMKLKQLNGAFLAFLAQPGSLLGIMPKEVAEGAEAKQVEIIGTGPYQLVEWIPDRYTKIKRFEDYKPIEGEEASGFAGYKAAYLDEIYFIPVPEGGARVAGLVAGEYDFADQIPPEEVPKLRENDKLDIVELMPFTWPVIYINHSEHSIFRNLKLRQALQAGLNLEEIMIVSATGSARLDPGMYFKEQIWHSDIGAEFYNQNNPEKAKKLMKEAGYNGEKIVILTNTSYDYMYKAGIALERQLSELGFNVELTVTDWPTQLNIRADLTKWDLSFSSHSIRFDPTMNDFYFLPETTFFGYNNPEMVKYLEMGKRSTKFEDRYEAYKNVQRIFYEDVAMIKLYDLGLYMGKAKYVKGYEPWYMIYFVNTWLDK